MKERSNIKNEFDAFDGSDGSTKSGGRSFSQILQEIVSHITEIVRSEVRLARVEVGEDVTQVTKAGVYVVIGAAFALQALGFVLLGLVYALGTMMPLWLSAVSVGAGVGVIAAVFLSVGRTKIKQASLKPDKTIRTLQENLIWMKKQAR